MIAFRSPMVACTGAVLLASPSPAQVPAGKAFNLANSLRAQMLSKSCWPDQPGMPADLRLVVRIRFKPDGYRASPPEVLSVSGAAKDPLA
jgi:hypothetical protein